MLRAPIVLLAAAATLLLAACTAPHPDPAEALPEGSTPPASSPTEEPVEVAESPYEPCDDANARALSALSTGEMLAAPTGDDYPDYLPLPSCVIQNPDFGTATAFFIPATQADFDTLEAAIAAEQGDGLPSDGQGLSTDGTVWDGQAVPGMFLVPPSLGVTLDFVFIEFKLT
jgi:hypothetical protein